MGEAMSELGVLLVLLSYLIGSIPFSFIFSRFLGGVDIRTKGTGNVGATNVLRSVGVKIAIAALAGDLAKGLLAAWWGSYFGGPGLGAVCSVAVVAGHCWPVFLRFRGGKGVATAAGVIFMLFPMVGLLEAVVFFTVVGLSRYVSLGSVTAALAFPFLVLLTHQPSQYVVMAIIIAAIIVYRHRSNIERIRKGTESKVNEKAL
ncbi:MAG TPA: glycerol-3-phosphate 1-O-acyltransferase PlsY [Syntrophomonadaceae bacterium]|nr:glycerol-3-phosphate 1-O-acyltransferase PlsY [Syntrophomonadaceae bacterium]